MGSTGREKNWWAGGGGKQATGKKTEKSRTLGSKSDLRFRSLQDQGTRKRIINGPELGCILWRTHLYVKLNNIG